MTGVLLLLLCLIVAGCASPNFIGAIEKEGVTPLKAGDVYTARTNSWVFEVDALLILMPDVAELLETLPNE